MFWGISLAFLAGESLFLVPTAQHSNCAVPGGHPDGDRAEPGVGGSDISVGTALVIQRDEEHVPATVVELSFYDPRGARIRI